MEAIKLNNGFIMMTFKNIFKHKHIQPLDIDKIFYPLFLHLVWSPWYLLGPIQAAKDITWAM